MEEIEENESSNQRSSENMKEYEEKLNRTLEIMQSNSVRTKEVYKALVYIRTVIAKQPESIKLLENEKCFKCLIKMLVHTNEDILNITISILSNLCNILILNEEFREEIRKTKTASRIVVIIRKISKGSIRIRICRLIGNLAQAHDISEELHRAGITHGVVHILNEAEDIELQQTAIRALRWLWHLDRHHGDMLKAGVVKAVANRLRLSAPDRNVEKAALRALVKFTHQRSPYTAEQMSGTYEKIVERLEEPVVSVLILNLSQDPIARVELCKAGIVPPILDQLQQGRTNPYLISGLCQMCREPMVRANLRLTPNGFPTLLSLLSKEKTKRFYPELLDAITQFNYDQPSLMLMVRCGLIGVLVDKLSEYSKVHCLGHTEAIPHDELGSPLSPASPSPNPSPSPPPFSPPSASDFSPRCPSPLSDSDSDSSSFIPQVERFAGDCGLDGCVLHVLRRLAYQETPMRALATKPTITALLNYISRLPYPRYQSNFHKAVSALTAIVGCKFYWNMLLDDESVLEIHAKLCRPLHEDCWECKRLADTGASILREVGMTAQSGLGEGEISYRLTGNSPPSRITAALTLTHVVRQGNLLESMLFSHGGMNVLLETLSSRTLEAASSLHSLFSTLDVHNPQLPSQMCSGCEVGRVRKESTVMLTVDDGSTVAANREALAHACPVFEAMFRGGFKESVQSTIRISEISASCLSHLTRILPEYCSCVLPKELPVLLEMIAASDRFLLGDLMEKVVGVVRDSGLSAGTVPQIYNWGLRCGHQYTLTANLSLDVVSYLFTSNILPTQRAQAVSTILATQDKDSFLLDISSILRTALTSYIKRQRGLQLNSCQLGPDLVICAL